MYILVDVSFHIFICKKKSAVRMSYLVFQFHDSNIDLDHDIWTIDIRVWYSLWKKAFGWIIFPLTIA